MQMHQVVTELKSIDLLGLVSAWYGVQSGVQSQISSQLHDTSDAVFSELSCILISSLIVSSAFPIVHDNNTP